MVDFSCALKLAMPISVLSAIREANQHKITVKGGKFLEAVAEADTIVFDKTGTLTKAQPTVAEVVSFSETKSTDELLRIAACLEEHFPHSMAKAVVDAAKEKHLDHEEMHSKVEYIVAHGISTTIEGKKAVIGSWHFVMEDEKCVIPEGMEDRFEHLPLECSHLYLAIEGKLSAVICIEDPLRDEAAAVVNSLKTAGIKKVVMMTGDSERTASAIAARVGVDEYYSEVLPEDKAGFVEKAKAEGHKVIMIGDGINDSPALSAADIGIAISDGAEIAREIADITIAADDLREVAFAHREASEAIGVVPLQEVVAVAGLVGERQIVVDHAVGVGVDLHRTLSAYGDSFDDDRLRHHVGCRDCLVAVAGADGDALAGNHFRVGDVEVSVGVIRHVLFFLAVYAYGNVEVGHERAAFMHVGEEVGLCGGHLHCRIRADQRVER